MSENKAAETPRPKSPFNRRVVLAMVGAILLGLSVLVYRSLTWDPNYVIKVDEAARLILRGDQGMYLIGVKCPQREDVIGKQAVAFVESCVLERHVRIETDAEEPKDGAGWTLGYLYYKDKDDGTERFLNEELLRRGLARADIRFPHLKHRKVFEAAEAEAKAKKIGVWAPGYKFPE